MMLKTMADIRADMQRAGFDDALIQDVIRARIELERSKITKRERTRKAKPQAYVCPQQRLDNAIIAGTHHKRGLIMVGEW